MNASWFFENQNKIRIDIYVPENVIYSMMQPCYRTNGWEYYFICHPNTYNELLNSLKEVIEASLP